jgi:cytochrome P450
MIIEFVRRIRELMHSEKATLEKNGTASEWMPSGLLELSHRMLFHPSTQTLFGDIKTSSLESDFRLFDAKIHYFTLNIPHWLLSWLIPKELKARLRLNRFWLKNVHPSRESQLVEARQILFQKTSDRLSLRDYGGSQTALLWASLGNTIPAVFWSMFYILQDAKAVEVIKQEIDTYLPSFSLDNDADESIIEEWTPEKLNSCVYLDSSVNETLRLVGGSLMIRKCKQETQIVLQDGRTLHVKPNESLVYFVAVTHRDENLFPEPDKFIFDRFVNKNADSVLGYMPFGSGKYICPGRFFAKNEVKICLAMLLRYMEYKFVDMERIPKRKPYRVGFGVAPPNQDVPIMYRYKV